MMIAMYFNYDSDDRISKIKAIMILTTLRMTFVVTAEMTTNQSVTGGVKVNL